LNQTSSPSRGRANSAAAADSSPDRRRSRRAFRGARRLAPVAPLAIPALNTRQRSPLMRASLSLRLRRKSLVGALAECSAPVLPFFHIWIATLRARLCSCACAQYRFPPAHRPSAPPAKHPTRQGASSSSSSSWPLRRNSCYTAVASQTRRCGTHSSATTLFSAPCSAKRVVAPPAPASAPHSPGVPPPLTRNTKLPRLQHHSSAGFGGE